MHLDSASIIAVAALVITVASIFASHSKLAKKIEAVASTVQKDAPVAAAVDAAVQVAQDVVEAAK